MAWLGLQETRGKPYPAYRRRQVRRGPSRGEAGRKEYANETCGAAGKDEPRVLIYASCSLHELDDGHFGVVPAARDGVQDPGVSTVPIPVAIGSSLEQRMHEILVVDITQSLTTLVQATSLGQSDHSIRVFADRFGPGLRGFDATVTQKFRGQAAEERLPLIRG